MNEALKLLLSLSLSGGLLILLLFLLRPLYKARLSKRWQYYIWLLAIARLLLPFAPETNVMAAFFQAAGGSAVQDAAFLPEEGPVPAPPSELPETGAPDGLPEISEREGPAATAGPAGNAFGFMRQNLWLIWLTAALILLVRKITLYQSFVKYIRAGCSEVADLDLLERFGALVEESGVGGTVELCTNGLISSPLLMGFFRPCIVLPTAELPEADFRYTILHELTHCRRRDLFYKWLGQLAVCVHWFNPLVHLMGRELGRACELSCDEAVIGRLDAGERRAYGDTLLNAVGAGNGYRDSLSSVTLCESKELLKERLCAIMAFQKNAKSAAVTAVVTAMLCFSAAFLGAYARGEAPPAEIDAAARSPEKQSETAGERLPSQLPGGLTLVEKEYTREDLKAQDICGVKALAFSEDVTITTGGDTLKLRYYTGGKDGYTVGKVSDGGGTRQYISIERTDREGSGETAGPISITVPEKAAFKTIYAESESGNVTMENCSAGMFFYAATKSGRVLIDGGSAEGNFAVETGTGDALIRGIALGSNDTGAVLETETGTIAFQPLEGAKSYRLIVDTGAEAQISVNGKRYAGGDYEINQDASRKLYFDSPRGSLIVQDAGGGDLTSQVFARQTAAEIPAVEPAKGGNLTRVRREYPESDLLEMGIAGTRIEAQAENIVVTQGGNSLILEYDQAYDGDYRLVTNDYEIYHGEFTTPEDIAMNGGKSGVVKQLRLIGGAVSAGPARTIYVTLPADPQYSRVVQLFSGSGSIQASRCSSTAMLDAATESGSVSLQNCSGPLLGASTCSGQMDVSGCHMKKFTSDTESGTLTLQLADRASKYKMEIETGQEAQISINGNDYPGGEYLFYESAPNAVSFKCKNGSLIIREPA